MAATDGSLNKFCVRQMTPDDILGIIELQVRAFPGLPPWRPDQLTRHMEVFPEGQLVGPPGRQAGFWVRPVR